MRLFLEARSDVDGNLYDDSLSCLNSHGIKVGILTNGNADLSKTVLGSLLSVCVTAGLVGAAKPSPVPFITCCQRLGVVPSEVLFVGDDYDKDVKGAKKAGMVTLFLDREKKSLSERDWEDADDKKRK